MYHVCYIQTSGFTPPPLSLGVSCTLYTDTWFHTPSSIIRCIMYVIYRHIVSHPSSIIRCIMYVIYRQVDSHPLLYHQVYHALYIQTHGFTPPPLSLGVSCMLYTDTLFHTLPLSLGASCMLYTDKWIHTPSSIIRCIMHFIYRHMVSHPLLYH